jgi:hypothetical protein
MLRKIAILAALIANRQGRPAAQADALFSFYSNPWMNLHHILWSRGQGSPLPADMPDTEREAWTAGTPNLRAVIQARSHLRQGVGGHQRGPPNRRVENDPRRAVDRRDDQRDPSTG